MVYTSTDGGSMKYLCILALVGLAACNSADATGPSAEPSFSTITKPVCTPPEVAIPVLGRKDGHLVLVGWYCGVTHS
jgi:hypothetical protein